MHSSSLSKPSAYIAHNASPPQTSSSHEVRSGQLRSGRLKPSSSNPTHAASMKRLRCGGITHRRDASRVTLLTDRHVDLTLHIPSEGNDL
ncbi:hypothetical protein EYF80_044806 [Liparis tanakae]|uniref:Uncharacterized protein n=1 Tax=Liparis tanakae TaxID=230148 RepID=A0A4Z2FVG1_9TELE|nr:hypothetical protein EYF80_044806 [Liparis tanakae]